MKKLAIIFDGSLRTDARILREIQSYKPNFDIDVYSNEVSDLDYQSLPENVKLIPYKSIDSWINVNLFYASRFSELLKIIDAKDYDVVICDNYPLLKIGVELKKKNPSLKIIYDSRELFIETINQFFPTEGIRKLYGIPLIWLNKIYHSYLEKQQVKQADYCVTVCSTIADIFTKEWGKEVYVLRNFPSLQHVSEQVNSELSLDASIKDTDFILLYQGNINPGRGLELMMEVMKHLPEKYHFIVLGDGMLVDKLKSMKAKWKLKNVHFISRVPYSQLLSITKRADLGVSLIEPINESKRLSLPNKLFEYISVGVPFLSNDLPEPRLLVEEYNCGVLVDINDFDSIVKTIISLSEERLKQLGQNGKQAYLTELNWEYEFAKFYQKLSL